MVRGMIYIIKLDTPYHHCKFYVGWCLSHRLESRLKEHRAGRGAKLLAACARAGITFRIVCTNANCTKVQERQIKNRKNTPKFVQSILEGKRPEWRVWHVRN